MGARVASGRLSITRPRWFRRRHVIFASCSLKLGRSFAATRLFVCAAPSRLWKPPFHKAAFFFDTSNVRHKTAHCVEGALFAAASLAYQGRTPWLLDIQTAPYDDDHVLALFKEGGHWGANNHGV